MKIGVLVVAYNAAQTIESVLDRVPDAFGREVAEILILDDHSSDRTLEVAEGYQADHPDLPITVVRQLRNLGYGGNQKSGYRYAADHGWDVAVMLHGDGQYAPEMLAEMVSPIVERRADAVFGSRMMTRSDALRGGMPRYKFAGNRALTEMQNRLTGLELTEWHSGYRAYRVATLTDLPMEGNSDGFDFDTEIILQLHAAEARIVEIPIPTYYGDEYCHVNGIAYARDIMIHTVRYRLGTRGFGSGQLGGVESEYGFKISDSSSHGRILTMMSMRPPCRVLDVGCGPGWLAERLRSMGHEVVGVDLVEHPDVRERTDPFVQADLDHGLPEQVFGDYEVILAADILEHVRVPERLLRQMTDCLTDDGVVLASVPNISHWYSRGRVALGQFDYDQRGILDRTHLRFFTRRSFLKLAHRCRLEPVVTSHTGLPLDAISTGAGSALGRFVRRADAFLVRSWPTMFAYQFVYEFSLRQPSAATVVD